MMNIMIKAHNKISRSMEVLLLRHPYADFIAMSIAVPILVLLAVSVFATAIMLPMSWLFGWL